ncbi:MAG: carbohydrate ABC transporter permease [Bacilli bacterium]
MLKNTSASREPIKIVAFFVLLFFSVIVLFPLLWAVVNSLREAEDIFYYPNSFFPTSLSKWTFGNYKDVFANDNYPVGRWFLNSLFVSSLSTIFYVIIASLAAYAFVFLKLQFANALFYFLIGTMTIPGIVIMVPQFTQMVDFGLIKNLWGLILPGLGGVYGLFLIRQFFMSIPFDLIESSRIDGAKDYKIFLKVVVPLGKSILLVQGMFGFLGAWNDLQWAQLIVAQAPKEMWTLAVGLAKVTEGNLTYSRLGLQLACTIISMLPILFMYLFVQDKIVEGVAMSGIKR